MTNIFYIFVMVFVFLFFLSLFGVITIPVSPMDAIAVLISGAITLVLTPFIFLFAMVGSLVTILLVISALCALFALLTIGVFWVLEKWEARS